MHTSTYKHFEVYGKQASTKIHSNADRTISPSIFKKIAGLILLVVAGTTLFLHERNNNMNGQSNHVYMVELKDILDKVVLLNENADILPENISKTIEELNNKLPKEEDLENFKNIII